ncbi:MAG: MBL fold metallo-hydrolase RNA specificity domain-containing protein [Verrucomicrobiota bacterium]
MHLTFLGAAGCVTGSAYLLETDRARVLVDFGLFQGFSGSAELNVVPPGLRAEGLDAVLLTHAHLDHTGRLPLLSRAGYRGRVHCTAATIDLTALILRDSAKVQAQDLVRNNRRRERAGKPPLVAPYDAADVEAVLTRLRAVPYDDPVEVAPGVRACFAEAGHMLGSASIKLFIEEGGRRRTIAFSGDLGPRGAPMLKDPEGFSHADVVVLESTYGDRDHRPLEATVAEFEGIVKQAVARGGKILVPTFAVGRTQLIIYLLATMFRRGVLPKFPLYLDSPMGIEATRILRRHEDLYDEDFQALNRERPLEADLDTLRATATPEESRALNDVAGPCLIMAGSGMCNAGRILHHLKQNLWRPEASVLFVGYQGQGTLGRLLVDGRKFVRIFGDIVAVRAGIHTLNGFSAHAGQSDLLRWLEPLTAARPRVFLTHGESRGRDGLTREIRHRHQLEPIQPEAGQRYEI